MPAAAVSSPQPTVEPDLEALLPSWLTHLRAERKSAATLEVYGTSVRLFIAWAKQAATIDGDGHASIGRPVRLDRTTVSDFVNSLLDAGKQAATARTRYQALRRFAAWLVDEEELDADPLLTSKPPKLDQKVVPELEEEQLHALLGTCSGKKSFIDRRDEAVLRLMIDTGVRAGEVIGLTVEDIDVRRELVRVVRGKGGKGRFVPIGPETARAIDRYLRLRAKHRFAVEPALWLGGGGQRFGYPAMWKALGARAQQAGLKGFHPHLMRHTFAGRWLAANGSEGGLMAVAGWTSRDMIDRYGRASASKRAIDESRGLALGRM